MSKLNYIQIKNSLHLIHKLIFLNQLNFEKKKLLKTKRNQIPPLKTRANKNFLLKI